MVIEIGTIVGALIGFLALVVMVVLGVNQLKKSRDRRR